MKLPTKITTFGIFVTAQKHTNESKVTPHNIQSGESLYGILMLIK